jgi:acylphosphatase
VRAIHAIVKGRVHGVFFRAYTRRTARALGISGWVRNKRDGTVECFAQGSEPEMTTFVKFLYKGSPAARVDSVEIKKEQTDSKIQDFRIVY